MQQRYNFHIDPERPTPEEIADRLSFDKAFERYQREHAASRRRGRFRVVRRTLAVAATILLLVSVPLLLQRSNGPSWTPQLAEAHFESAPLIDPPLPDLAPRYVSRVISAGETTELQLAKGTRLNVPSGSFTDETGALVDGEVTIRYRELMDQVDFFLSGLPMTYDTAQKPYQLLSAGMVEITAEKNGETLQMAPDKAIEIELVSEIALEPEKPRPQFKIYKLEPAQRNWVYQAENRQEWRLPELDNNGGQLQQDALADLQEALADIQKKDERAREEILSSSPLPPKPVKPYAMAPGTPTFELNLIGEEVAVENAEGQALSDEEKRALQEKFASTNWQVSSKTGEFDTRAFGVTWDAFRLKPINAFEYELTLVHEVREQKLIVSPVLTADAMAEANAQYQQSLLAYEQALEARQQELGPALAALDDQAGQQREEVWAAYRNAIARANPDALQTAILVSRFSANSLGIWNVDRPAPPADPTVRARFVNSSNMPLHDRTAWMVESGQNTLRQYFAANGTPLPLDPEHEQVLWVLTDDKRLAICRAAQLPPATGESDEIKLVFVEEPVRYETEAELRRVLNI